jgi:N-acetylglucosamine kinase-like BadF-type ATPase
VTHKHAYFLGVDGGGTHVRAVIVDRHGTEVGRGRAGSANPAAVGLEVAVANVREAARSAAQIAGIDLPVAAAWCGLAGVDRPADHAALTPLLEGLADYLRLVNDAELALVSLPGGYGICLVAGTGSIAVGRDAHGYTARAGGWGHVMGDEGSGYDLGRRALQAVAKAADGRGPRTALQDAVLSAWALHSPEELMGRVYPQEDTKVVGELAPVVFQVAAEGDEVARLLIEQAASELPEIVMAVARQLEFEGALPLALTGGLLCRQPVFQARVVELLREQIEVGDLVTVSDPALAAAISLAKETLQRPE